MTKREKYKKRREKELRQYHCMDYILARQMVYDAYRAGFINWNRYQMALDKITSNSNGSWMFEQ